MIVSGSFYPENSPRSFRTTELAKEFSRQGHDVLVYFPFKGDDYSDFCEQTKIKLKDLGARRFKRIKLTEGGPGSFIRRALRRILNLLFEYPDIELMFKVARRLRYENNYDLLVSIAVPFPIHWGVAMARKRKNIIAEVWVADCGDPYMGDTTDSFGKLFYFKYIEKWFSRKADFITIPFGGAKKAYYKEFHGKIKIIPQGFQLDNMNIPRFKKETDYPVFAYAGGFIPGKRDPSAVLNYLSTINKKFKFIIYTSQAGFLLPFKSLLNEKLVIQGYIPREELLKNLAGMDFLINFDNNTQTQLPSKLIDYAITGRPVLNITSETDLSVLEEFLDGHYNDKMKLEDPSNYDIRVVAGKFLDLLNKK